MVAIRQRVRRLGAVALTWAGLACAGCTPPTASGPPAILLFSGDGTSPNDVRAIEALLIEMGQRYAAADSARLNGMSKGDLKAFRLILVPGGNYLKMGASLTPVTATNLHQAVQGGVNYLVICAGGLLAGTTASNSFNLTDGVRVGFYAAVNRGIQKQVVAITTTDGGRVDHYWEDGPAFVGWGRAVARYPDGTPAVVEGPLGKGRVLLCGFHPEAPESWRRGMVFQQPVTVAHAYARTLIDAALNGTDLPPVKEP